jgi:hypothetical protein
VTRLFLVGLAVAVFCTVSLAQHTATDMTSGDMTDMSGMPSDSMNKASESFIGGLEQHASSGTDALPNSTRFEMPMWQRGKWMLMIHGAAFLNDIQQSGARGADKFFSTNWVMPMAQRKFGRSGTLTFRTMLSLEPATVSRRRYPELFQQGETAFGKPIVDGQHPHDFFMEVAALYDYKLRENTLLSIYVAPVGSPGLGPAGYPHRASAAEDPLAPLGHHLEDSTHIANDVITAGIAYKNIRLEASGFHGQEPDEDRWDIDAGRIDSWSTRVTFNPGQNWSMQYSLGQLAGPEALFPNETVRRMTASLTYNRPIHAGNWTSMILWGRNQSLEDGNVGNAYLLESTLRFLNSNTVWTRIENVDRTNELLSQTGPLPAGFVERYFTRVQAYTFGYDRELGHTSHISTALGGQLTAYGVPAALSASYGSHPFGAVVFLRLRTR